MRVARASLRLSIERKDVADGLVEVFGLVKQCLAMKRSDVLVEVDGEEIKAPDAGLELASVVLKIIMEIVGRLRSNWSDLLVASGIARDEENRDTTQLVAVECELGCVCFLE